MMQELLKICSDLGTIGGQLENYPDSTSSSAFSSCLTLKRIANMYGNTGLAIFENCWLIFFKIVGQIDFFYVKRVKISDKYLLYRKENIL